VTNEQTYTPSRMVVCASHWAFLGIVMMVAAKTVMMCNDHDGGDIDGGGGKGKKPGW
jgi:hypothetical protein